MPQYPTLGAPTEERNARPDQIRPEKLGVRFGNDNFRRKGLSIFPTVEMKLLENNEKIITSCVP